MEFGCLGMSGDGCCLEGGGGEWQGRRWVRARRLMKLAQSAVCPIISGLRLRLRLGWFHVGVKFTGVE